MRNHTYERALIKAKEIMKVAKKYQVEEFVDKAFNEIFENNEIRGDSVNAISGKGVRQEHEAEENHF